jgi:SAM-dependent methyltransferase
MHAHYGREGLGASLLEALEKAGKNPDALTVEDLAQVDEFHLGGRKRTLELGRLAGLSKGMRVVDVGCGIGGPARALAHFFGCDVIGVDLIEEFCAAARLLNERTGLARAVDIRQGSALDLPLEDRSVDVAWMQHVGMNIEDKVALFKELARVLRSGGKLALYEVFAGPEGGLHLPVPWASSPELNFLVSPEEAQAVLEAAEFRIEVWNDVTGESTLWFQGALDKAREHGPPPLSLATLMGPEFPVKAGNVLRNLKEDRTRVVQAVLTLHP